MNRVLFISLRGEREVHQGADLAEVVAEAVRLNEERGYRGGVHVVERDDGVRMCAADCIEFVAAA